MEQIAKESFSTFSITNFNSLNKKTKAQLINIIEEVVTTYNNLYDLTDKLNNSLTELNKDIIQERNKIDKFKLEINTLTRNNEELNNIIEKRNKDYKKAIHELNTIKDTKKLIELKYDELKDKYFEKKEELDACLDNYQKEIDNYVSEKQEYFDDIKKYKFISWVLFIAFVLALLGYFHQLVIR